MDGACQCCYGKRSAMARAAKFEYDWQFFCPDNSAATREVEQSPGELPLPGDSLKFGVRGYNLCGRCWSSYVTRHHCFVEKQYFTVVR